MRPTVDTQNRSNESFQSSSIGGKFYVWITNPQTIPESIKELDLSEHSHCYAEISSNGLPDGLELLAEMGFDKVHLALSYTPKSWDKLKNLAGIPSISIQLSQDFSVPGVVAEISPKILSLGAPVIKSVPKMPASIEELNIRSVHESPLRMDLSHCTALQRLTLRSVDTSGIVFPPDLSTLTLLTCVVDELPHFPSLTKFGAYRCFGLYDMSIVCKYTQLKELSLVFCDISVIPPQIRFLSGLEVLDLNQNHIRELPREMRYLIKLSKLYIAGNIIQQPPVVLEELPELLIIDIDKSGVRLEDVRNMAVYVLD